MDPAPNFTPEQIASLKPRVEQALDKIRPVIEGDGGVLELIDITPQGVAVVQMGGHCETCSLSPVTMKAGVMRVVMEDVPEIRGVESML
jgi:Fe-S cluster biogenesis protein NfuA